MITFIMRNEPAFLAASGSRLFREQSEQPWHVSKHYVRANIRQQASRERHADTELPA
jgi:hypothetical protein